MNKDGFSECIQSSNKIALLVPNFAPFSGDARVVDLQARALIALGKDVEIITLNNEMASDLPVISLGMPDSLFFQRIYRLIFPIDILKIHRILPTLSKYDMVISHLYPMNWLAYLAKNRYGIKYIYWYHGIPTPNLQPHFYERVYLKLFIKATEYTSQNANLIISVSEFARDEFRKYAGMDSVVVYNAVDPKFHKNINGTRIRQKYNLGNSPVLLNVGVVCPPKGADLLIRAFRLIRQEIPDARLMIIGKATFSYYLEELKKIADDSVLFLGFVPEEDLPFYYGACDVYVTCSQWETYNLPLAEAQQCGKPVVAFDIGPHNEIINTQGILVEKGNIPQFVKACIQLLRERKRC